MIYLSDVDVVRKLAACGFLPLLAELLTGSKEAIDVRYLASLRNRLNRPKHRLKNEVLQAHLADFCETYDEVTTSADINRQEELIAAGIDSGEAILFAEAESTHGIVVTGDKRALLAYRKISTAKQRRLVSVVCWEQLLLRVHDLHGFEHLKQGCCLGLSHDKMIQLAFSSGEATQEQDAIDCINSFLRSLTNQCEDLLFEFP